MPWLDRHGRFLPLNAATLLFAMIPGTLYSYWWVAGELGARAVSDMIHASGLWAIRFLLVALAVTPLARLLHWSRLLTVRRMVGVTAAAYSFIHLVLYVVEQKFALIVVVTEISTRIYLTIGFVAFAGLLALTATSTDASIRRMGRSWKWLHWLAYPITVLTLWHYVLQSKANVSEAVFAAGLFVWLMLWRASPEVWQRSFVTNPLLAVVTCLLTAAIEFGWYGLVTGINSYRVLESNLSVEFGLRPAHWVFIVTMGVAVTVSLRRLMPSRRVSSVSAVRSSDPIRARRTSGS